MSRGGADDESRVRARLLLGPWGLGRARRPAAVDANGSMPDRADLLLLDYSFDGEPWVGVTGRTNNINTHDLGYSLNGEPFIGVSA